MVQQPLCLCHTSGRGMQMRSQTCAKSYLIPMYHASHKQLSLVAFDSMKWTLRCRHYSNYHHHQLLAMQLTIFGRLISEVQIISGLKGHTELVDRASLNSITIFMSLLFWWYGYLDCEYLSYHFIALSVWNRSCIEIWIYFLNQIWGIKQSF